MDPSDRAGSSTSPPRLSQLSDPSAPGYSTSDSPGSPRSRRGLGAGAVRELAARYGIRPSKSLGQHFLIDPNLARAIVADAEVDPGRRVVEVGAGFGSLTVALAEAGARVLAIEFDRALIPALEEAVDSAGDVEVLHADAMEVDWSEVLGAGPWTMCSNLPYNVAVPLVLTMLAGAPGVERYVVMVQREVGERLVASPGDAGFGAVSLRVAYRASASVVRRVPASVFWPRPNVDSVIVRLDRLREPAIGADPVVLWRVIEAGFAERRKTMRNALRRLGLSPEAADEALGAAGVAGDARAEQLDLATMGRLAEAVG